jgi:hypothetical protein
MSETQADVAADVPPDASAGGSADLRCAFKHPFFAYFESHGGGRFRLDEATGGAAFHARIGESMEFTLLLGPLARELGLDAGDSPDVARLRMAAEAVNYVETLELGDDLPAEVTTGQPSWPVPEHYVAQAQSKLSTRITVWVSRSQADGTASGAQAQAVLALLGRAAPAGERGGAGESPPRLRTDGVVQALAYVDCLRDRALSALSALSGSAEAAAMLLSSRSQAGIAAEGLARVVAMARRRVEADMAAAAAEPADLAAALLDPAATCARLADWRNRLYIEVRRLEATVRPWQGVMLAADAPTKELVFRTYRVLGRRDLPADAWPTLEAKLAAALLPPGAAKRRPDAAGANAPWHRMVWERNKDGPAGLRAPVTTDGGSQESA